MGVRPLRKAMLLLAVAVLLRGVSCLLQPQESESRELRPLEGLWKFKVSPRHDHLRGFKQSWYKYQFSQLGDCIDMPVPSSYNDVTTNETIRDHVGWVWYQRTFYAPKHWTQSRLFIHFESVHYIAKVWLNGDGVGEHVGGHIGFEFELTGSVKVGANQVTVAVNNTLTNHTLPQGFTTHTNQTSRYPKGYTVYGHAFDYFDYAGINRPVYLYTTPRSYITDIKVETAYQKVKGEGEICYEVKRGGGKGGEGQCWAWLEGEGGLTSVGCQGIISLARPKLWTPSPRTPHLYTLAVVYKEGADVDIYRVKVGIRSVSHNATHILVNEEPVYLVGVGMHEDSNIRGRGFDWVTLARDFALLSWLGVNSIRTSHYPYSTHFLDLADQHGIMVILEAPACSLNNFDDVMLGEHIRVMREIVDRDKNHPSIIAWSLANEPASDHANASPYFRDLSKAVRQMDPTRLVTFVTSQQVSLEKAMEWMDMVCLNRYSGWYQDGGKLGLVRYQVENELSSWRQKYGHPVVITEYGAGALSYLHQLPSTMWSEDYQSELLSQHFAAFDSLREGHVLSGEMIWNFADFNTPQEYIRPGVCAKGLFTRERQPKMAAYTTRERYQQITNTSCTIKHCN